MAPRARRRFTLLDAMILIVAFAAVFPASRQILEKTFRSYPMPYEGFFDFWRGAARTASMGLAPILGSLTIALTALQWRRPRLTWRMMGRAPGLAACAAASTVLVVEAALGVDRAVVGFRNDFPGWWLPFAARNSGGAVAGAWLAMAASRRRPWRRDGLDRAGIVLGACWILSYLITFSQPYYKLSQPY